MHLLLFEQLQKTAFFPDVFCDSGDDENIQCQRLVLLSKKKSRQIEVVKSKKSQTYVFSRIFQVKNFHNFSCQIEVVNSQKVPNLEFSRIFKAKNFAIYFIHPEQ